MIRKIISLALPALFAAAASAADIAPSSVNVRFESPQAADSILSLRPDLKLERIIPAAPNPELERRHREAGLHLWFKASTSGREEALREAAALRKVKGVRAAAPASFIRIPRPQPFAAGTPQSQPAKIAARSAEATVNDPLYHYQWHYSNPDYANIDLEKAWDLEKGNRNVVVAVMDGAVEYTHPDLAANCWVNEAELNGLPGVDDDGNGYVDDIHGLRLFPDNGFADHATHIAGTIAAVNGNATGVCGIAGGNGRDTGVRVMSIAVSSESGSEFVNDADLLRGFVYAADNGAVIASNSWADFDPVSSLKVDAINYFIRNAGKFKGSPLNGGLVVFAAANENSTDAPSPINSVDIDRNSVLIVGAVSAKRVKASFSNYGRWVDIAAPGGGFDGKGIYSTLTDGRYGFMNGTSMACPHASGVAALVVSHFRDRGLTPAEVRRLLMDTSSPIDGYQAGYPYAGKIGKGLLNAALALQSDPGVPPALPTEPSVRRLAGTPFDCLLFTWTVPADGNGNAPAYCALYEDGKDSPTIKIRTNGQKVGSRFAFDITGKVIPIDCRYRMRSVDAWGNESELSDIIPIPEEADDDRLWNTYNNDNFVVYRPCGTGFEYAMKTADVAIPVRRFNGYYFEVCEPNNIVAGIHKHDHCVRFELKPTDATPLGTFPLTVKAVSLDDPSDVSELKLSYTVYDKLRRITGPAQKDNEITHLYVSDLSGTISLNVRNYVADPLGLEFVIPDENGDAADNFFFNRLDYRVEKETLTIDYELNPEQLEWFDDPVKLTIHPYNTYYVTGEASFFIHYRPESSVYSVSADVPGTTNRGIYTITGIRLDQPRETLDPGLYIIDGRKVHICR